MRKHVFVAPDSSVDAVCLTLTWCDIVTQSQIKFKRTNLTPTNSYSKQQRTEIIFHPKSTHTHDSYSTQ